MTDGNAPRESTLVTPSVYLLPLRLSVNNKQRVHLLHEKSSYSYNIWANKATLSLKIQLRIIAF